MNKLFVSISASFIFLLFAILSYAENTTITVDDANGKHSHQLGELFEAYLDKDGSISIYTKIDESAALGSKYFIKISLSEGMNVEYLSLVDFMGGLLLEMEADKANYGCYAVFTKVLAYIKGESYFKGTLVYEEDKISIRRKYPFIYFPNTALMEGNLYVYVILRKLV